MVYLSGNLIFNLSPGNISNGLFAYYQGPDFDDLKIFKNDLQNDRKNPEKRPKH
jgi:hypothetical protein